MSEHTRCRDFLESEHWGGIELRAQVKQRPKDLQHSTVHETEHRLRHLSTAAQFDQSKILPNLKLSYIADYLLVRRFVKQNRP